MNDETAIVQTVDFFTPVVDDPYSFGQITAANALSDIYAMGAKPLLALNIIGFPKKVLPLDVLVEILKGGAAKVKEAGALLVGGHTIDDDEPKYGLAVTGLVHPDRVVTNAGALPGDVLFLTKPLGTGIITTAIKGDLVDEQTHQAAVEIMVTLNDRAASAMAETGVNACTDVTGFGLLGHLYEMVSASGTGGRVYLNRVPFLERAYALALMGMVPAGAYRNLQYLKECVRWVVKAEEVERLILADPQTSGGLLISVPRAKAKVLNENLVRAGVSGVEIGEIVESEKPLIYVEK